MDKKKKSSNDPVTLVKDRIEQGTDWKMMRQIQINRAFYEGYQWISWDNASKRVYMPPLRRGEIRYTYNKVKPAIITLLAKLTKSRVQLEVIPDTNDDERIEVAKAGQKYIKHQWDQDKMDQKTRKLKLHMLIDGFPALKVFADKTQGKEFETDDGQMMKTGKIVTLIVDQTRLKIDPSATDVEEIRWVVDQTPRDVDDIQAEYGVEVAPEGNIEIQHNVEQYTGSDNTKKYSNHAMVNEYWEWPCAKYPNGRKITTAGGQKLDETDNPGENPYIFFGMIPVPGRAIADGIVKDMTTPQRSYNVKRTAEARILEEMGNPMWMKPQGSVVDDDDITNEIGGILEYIPIGGAEPKRVEGVEPGNGWQAAMERDEADLEDISGAHEISQGAVPKGVDTYGGLQLLVEQDETKLAIAAHSFEEGMKKWGEKVLRLVQKYFPEEQQLEIVGENGEVDSFTFAGADLSGNEVIDVIKGSSMPESKVAKEAKIFQMWGAGMFTDPKTGMADVRKVTRMLGQSISSSYYEDSELDENKAKMESRTWEKYFEDEQIAQALMEWQQLNQMYQMQAQTIMMQGGDPSMLPPPPEPPVKLPAVRDFYDHETHLECHNRFRKGDVYDKLPPQLQALIDQHCMEHEQYLQMPMMQQQQQQQAQKQEVAKEKQKEFDNTMQRDLVKYEADIQKSAMKHQNPI
jgi:hypothetical protein